MRAAPRDARRTDGPVQPGDVRASARGGVLTPATGLTLRELAPHVSLMSSGGSDEYAALVALLQAEPGGLSWPEITAQLLELGSAVKVWERYASRLR